MEELFDGARVRLRSRWHDQYLCADEDGESVVLSDDGASLNAVWRVYREELDDINYVLFCCAASDGYLSFVLREEHPHGPVPVHVEWVYGEPEPNDVLWQVVQFEDGSGDVLLRHPKYGLWPNLDAANNTSMCWIVEAVPAMESSPESDEAAPLAVDYHFPDGTHVRLRSAWDEEPHYLYAEEDGYSLARSTDRASLNTVWGAHRLVRDGISYVLLHGAAYGRYLSAVHVQVNHGPEPHFNVVQSVYSEPPEQNNVLWQVFEFEAAGGTYHVLLDNKVHGMWYPDDDPENTSIWWIVEAVPPRDNPPELPPATPPPMVGGRNRRVGLAPPEFQRTIRHQVDINAVPWGMLEFNGRSVFNLRNVLARELNEVNALNITLCVRAGSQGRLTPLVVDLPADNREMEIVVFSTGSQDAEALVYPRC